MHSGKRILLSAAELIVAVFDYAPGSDHPESAGTVTAVVDRDLGFIPAGQEGLAGGGHVGPTRW